jgi:hypothetical protein
MSATKLDLLIRLEGREIFTIAEAPFASSQAGSSSTLVGTSPLRPPLIQTPTAFRMSS